MNGDLHHPPPSLPPPESVCEDCNASDSLFLHNVARKAKSPPQKLCTSCVLQHYRNLCCAECFELYDANSLTAPPQKTATTTGNNQFLPCMRCGNWSHFNCPKPKTPKSPYICPSCSPRSVRYFEFKKPGEGSSNGNMVIGKEDAMRLYSAARISAITMNKAAAAARLEADRRVKEAALAKKRAKEAIEHVFTVSARVGAKRREVAQGVGVPAVNAVPRSVNYAPVRLERNGGDAEPMNGVERGTTVNGNGVAAPVPMAIVTPHLQINNGGDHTGGKDDGNVAQTQLK